MADGLVRVVRIADAIYGKAIIAGKSKDHATIIRKQSISVIVMIFPVHIKIQRCRELPRAIYISIMISIILTVCIYQVQTAHLVWNNGYIYSPHICDIDVRKMLDARAILVVAIHSYAI